MRDRGRKKQVKKNHHSVPARYLQRFVGADGQLWAYGRNLPKPFQQIPQNVGYTKYLYAPLMGPEPRDDSVEDWLAENIDGPAVVPMDKLVSGAPLSEQERYHVAAYLAYQELRIPRTLDRMKGFEERTKQVIAQLYAAHPDAIRAKMWRDGVRITPDQLNETVAELRAIGQGKRPVEVTKETWLETFGDLEEVIEIILSLSWVVAVAPPGFEFVTSDAPLVKIVTDPRVPRRLAGGWLSPSAEARFPLDPHHLLVIHQDPYEGRVDYPIDGCIDANRLTVSRAHQFVFSRSKESFILDQWNSQR